MLLFTKTMSGQTVQFLQEVAPFNLLPESELVRLAETAQRFEYAEDTLLYRQDTSLLQEISLIESGQIEKYWLREDGSKTYTETFGRGETIGAISILLNSERALRSVRTIAPTVIYQWSRAAFLALCSSNAEFNEFFTNQFGWRMLNGGYVSMLMRRPEPGMTFQQGDLAFTQPLRDFYNPQLNICPANTSIREAAKSMTYFRRDYVLVVDPNHEPVGIVTDLDLRDKVVAAGLSTEQPVSAIMSTPLLEIGAEAFSYEAIMLMFRRKVNHLVVRDQGRVAGIITLDQLLHAQGKSPFIFIQRIAHEHSTEGLRRNWEELPGIIQDLNSRGTRPEIINQIVSTVADAITHNIIRRVIKRLGPPPARFVFLALGSEGRKEQTLKTDQDNALLYEDVAPERAAAVSQYFLELGVQVSDELYASGFAYCEGGLMAKNPDWNQPLSKWVDNYRRWIEQPVPEHVMIGSAFFDCRAIFGETALIVELRDRVFALLADNDQTFLSQLARAALVNKPPLSLFGNFQLTETPQRKGVNIKRAMQVVSDFARIYALRHQLRIVNTTERLEKLRELDAIEEAEFNELNQAFFFMMDLRLEHQIAQIASGQSPDNLIDPDALSKIQRLTLREIFKVLEKYQKRIGVVFAGILNG
ncbi:MAG: DUF294 nucleotidyltransferase-like domain-containing protein [Bacteroidia bacterium]